MPCGPARRLRRNPATTGAESDGGGNARIETHLVLPDPCIAPIVSVASPGGAWFSATDG